MANKAFPRIYKNNTKYEEDSLLFIDALAFTVQKHLYKKNDIYYLGGTITLYDFMTLTRYYIAASMSEFGQSDIETYISAMDDPSVQFFGGEAVQYTKDHNFIILNGTPAMIMSLMWAAWIYARVRLNIHSEGNNKIWQRAAEQLYNSMEDYYDAPDHKCFRDKTLIDIAHEAMKTMETYIVKQLREGKYAQRQHPAPAKEQQVSTGGDVAQLQARIAELEAELENKNNDIEAYKTQGKGVSASKNAILLTTLCHHFGGLPQNGRQSLSPIFQKLYGYTEATATRALNQKFKQTDVDALAKLFSGLSPRVGNAIKEMPSIIEKQNNERLRKLNEP